MPQQGDVCGVDHHQDPFAVVHRDALQIGEHAQVAVVPTGQCVGSGVFLAFTEVELADQVAAVSVGQAAGLVKPNEAVLDRFGGLVFALAFEPAVVS